MRSHTHVGPDAESWCSHQDHAYFTDEEMDTGSLLTAPKSSRALGQSGYWASGASCCLLVCVERWGGWIVEVLTTWGAREAMASFWGVSSPSLGPQTRLIIRITMEPINKTDSWVWAQNCPFRFSRNGAQGSEQLQSSQGIPGHRQGTFFLLLPCGHPSIPVMLWQ